MKSPLLILVTAVALATSISNASAQALTQMLSFGPGIPDYNTALVFNKYNGNLADLQSVTISYTLGISGGSLILDNDSNTASSYSVSFGAEVALTSPTQTLLNAGFNPVITNAVAANIATGNLGANVGDGTMDYDSSAPDGVLISGTDVSSFGSGSINDLFLSQYVGSGTFTINALTKQYSSLGSLGGIEYAFTPLSAQGTLSVTYNVVPEASSSLLSLVGGFFLLRRRR